MQKLKHRKHDSVTSSTWKADRPRSDPEPTDCVPLGRQPVQAQHEGASWASGGAPSSTGLLVDPHFPGLWPRWAGAGRGRVVRAPPGGRRRWRVGDDPHRTWRDPPGQGLGALGGRTGEALRAGRTSPGRDSRAGLWKVPLVLAAGRVGPRGPIPPLFPAAAPTAHLSASGGWGRREARLGSAEPSLLL